MPAATSPLRLRTALLAAAVAGLSVAVQAKRGDRNAPMHAEADAMRYDEARQTSVFTGRVVITKGTIVIRAHEVEVRQNAQGEQFGIALGDGVQRAYYRQKRDSVDEYIEGVADRIEYDGQADRVTLRGHAELRRYRGTVLYDRVSGALVVYDNRSETFSVDGDQAQAAADNPSGRVRALLTPRAADAPAREPVPDTRPPVLVPSERLERQP